MAWLLDTNICIYLINRKPGHEAVLQHLEGRRYGQILISTITLAELHFGIAKSAQRSRNEEKVVSFLQRFEIIDFDGNAAAVYGILRTELEKSGKAMGPLDTLIAAHALASRSTLVTDNLREFRRVRGLKMVNWTRA